MCFLCEAKTSAWVGRRAFLLAAAGSAVAAPAAAQVEVGKSSNLRKLVPAGDLEQAAAQQYAQMMAEASSKGALAPQGNPQLARLQRIATKLVPQTFSMIDRSAKWGIIKKNTAARYKSRLTLRLRKLAA